MFASWPLSATRPMWTHWSPSDWVDRYRFGTFAIAWSWAGSSCGGSLLTEGSGEVLAELFVLLGELPDAVIGGFEPAQQGRLGGALARRNLGCGCSGACCPQLFDLGA